MAFLDEEVKENTEETVETVESEDLTVEEEIIVEDEKGNDAVKFSKDGKKSSNKKPSKIKAAFSELKKVSYPSFGSVVKKTAVVLSVTLIFLIVVIGIDQLLYLLYNLLTKNM